jgi:hypothetical protein
VEARDRLQELGSSRADGTRRRPAVSARAGCRQTIWDTTVLVGTLMSGTAVLLDLLIEESIQLHFVSALIFATVPAAAALVVGATLVTLLGLLGISYDIIRTLVVPGLLYCVCFSTDLLIDFAYAHKGDIGRAITWGAGGPIQFTRALAIWIGQILRRAGTRTRSALTWVSREIALEALWINQGARRVLDMTKLIGGWPIRSSARLMLRLSERKGRASDVFGFALRQDCR